MITFIAVSSYVVFAVLGSTLLKYGGLETIKSMFTIPVINMSISLITLIGFISYGISFLIYTVLLNKYNLSFISPVTVGIVYVLLMITSFIIFKETFTTTKLIGSSLILVGVLIMATTGAK